eukprot:GHVP01066664.1.p2 GENE.GHVP01066664.1~~GHVP01066664.1.p2  ORF type:complete len:463 (+),score=87.93 GHVP01066664.1:3090-4478(+)
MKSLTALDGESEFYKQQIKKEAKKKKKRSGLKSVLRFLNGGDIKQAPVNQTPVYPSYGQPFVSDETVKKEIALNDNFLDSAKGDDSSPASENENYLIDHRSFDFTERELREIFEAEKYTSSLLLSSEGSFPLRVCCWNVFGKSAKGFSCIRSNVIANTGMLEAADLFFLQEVPWSRTTLFRRHLTEMQDGSKSYEAIAPTGKSTCEEALIAFNSQLLSVEPLENRLREAAGQMLLQDEDFWTSAFSAKVLDAVKRTSVERVLKKRAAWGIICHTKQNQEDQSIRICLAISFHCVKSNGSKLRSSETDTLVLLKLAASIQDILCLPAVIGGDFNCVLDNLIDASCIRKLHWILPQKTVPERRASKNEIDYLLFRHPASADENTMTLFLTNVKSLELQANVPLNWKPQKEYFAFVDEDDSFLIRPELSDGLNSDKIDINTVNSVCDHDPIVCVLKCYDKRKIFF